MARAQNRQWRKAALVNKPHRAAFNGVALQQLIEPFDDNLSRIEYTDLVAD